MDGLTWQIKYANNSALYSIVLSLTHSRMAAGWENLHVKLLFNCPARFLNISFIVHHLGLDRNVWIVSFKGVWIAGLDRGSGSHVGPEHDPDLIFWLAAIYIHLHTYTTLHYTTLHYTTLHYTTLHYTILHYTTLHYTTLHYTTLHYTTLHYGLRVFCSRNGVFPSRGVIFPGLFFLSPWCFSVPVGVSGAQEFVFFCPWNRFECYRNRFFGSLWYFRCPEGFSCARLKWNVLGCFWFPFRFATSIS